MLLNNRLYCVINLFYMGFGAVERKLGHSITTSLYLLSRLFFCWLPFIVKHSISSFSVIKKKLLGALALSGKRFVLKLRQALSQ